MGKALRVGVVGTSWWADMMHLPALKSHPSAVIAAICGRNRERAEEMAQKYGVRQVFTDYGDMLEKGHLQALIVATPDDLHYPMTMAALDAGLHVLCEKPLALNLRQATEMVEKAEAMGVKHMVLYTYRWIPAFRFVRQLVDEGYIGRCYHAQLRFFGGSARSGEYQWKWDRRRTVGILGDLGSHMIDFAHWVLGDVARVSAHLATFIERSGLPGQTLDPAHDSALLSLEFQNGAQASLYAGAVSHLGDRDLQQEITLYGEKGTLEVEVKFSGVEAGTTIRGARHNQQRFTALSIPDHMQPEEDHTTPMEEIRRVFTGRPAGVRLFVEAILQDRSVSPDFSDGLKVQEVLEAAIESDRQRCWIDL